MIRARRPPAAPTPDLVRDPAILEGYLDDASGAGPGTTPGLVRPADEASAAAFLRQSDGPVLFQAARSSLTGGAVPQGETLLSVERMTEIGRIETFADRAHVTVQPGVRLCDLQARLAEQGWYYPPVPTFQEAMIGGAVSTNAGGAASFKYGTTRDWVRGVGLLLFNGERIRIVRGEASVRAGERFEIGLTDGAVLSVPTPTYRLPDLRKISAGYHASDPFDLIDLFLGAEGTLGLISEVTLELVRHPQSVITALVFLADPAEALELAGELRRVARTEDDRDPDVRSIECLDRNCLHLLRIHGDARRLRIEIPEDAGAALLFETELPERATDEEAQRLLEGLLSETPGVPDVPLARLFAILHRRGLIDRLELAFPEDTQRRRSLHALREATPQRIGEILQERRRTHPQVRKVGGDLIVPFEQLHEMLPAYEEGFRRRGLDFAVWGHLSDGNLHPNAIPADADQVELALDAQLEFAERAVALGGCPLSEHGVGRNPVKQEMLRRFLGHDAVDQMRSIKRALDPPYRFGPGVLFPPA